MSLFRRKKPTETPLESPTFKARVDAFWAWFANNAEHITHLIEQQKGEELVELTSTSVRGMMPVGWVYGPGESDEGHSLTLSPEGDRGRQFLSVYWKSRAPNIPGWSFHPAKPPSLHLDSAIIGMFDRDFSFNEFRVATDVDDDQEKINITAWHPHFEKMDEAERMHILFICLDEILGEFGTETKIGTVDIEEVPAESMPLSDLPKAWDFLAEDKGWSEKDPTHLFSGYSLREPGTDFLRHDSFVGSTSHSDLIGEFFDAKGRPDNLLDETGADFVYVHIPREVFPEGNEVDARTEIEQYLDARLISQSAGHSIGGAMGHDRGYLDFIIFDGEESLRQLLSGMRELNLPDDSGIAFFASERQMHGQLLGVGQ